MWHSGLLSSPRPTKCAYMSTHCLISSSLAHVRSSTFYGMSEIMTLCGHVSNIRQNIFAPTVRNRALEYPRGSGIHKRLQIRLVIMYITNVDNPHTSSCKLNVHHPTFTLTLASTELGLRLYAKVNSNVGLTGLTPKN